MKHVKLITTPETSKRMSKVKLKMGVAEVNIQKSLWQKGIRYRKNYRKILGSPDIAITSQRIVIFIDGEFWHGKDWENRKHRLKTNKEYWIAKIEENIVRDNKINLELENQGWRVIRFWEKDARKNCEACVRKILDAIESVKSRQN